MIRSGRFARYDAAAFRKDLVSGILVGIIAIPLGMAFAIASGVKPEYGIYTTIVAGVLISLFGGSRFQIGGPTGAFIPILFAIVMQHGYEDLLIAGLMAGVLLVLMGLLRLGSLIKFIPRPVTIGFTSGIAVIIFSGQIPSFLGLKDVQRHEFFGANMKEIFLHLSTLNFYSVALAAIGLAVILISPRLWPKVPGSLISLLVTSVIAYVFFRDQVATIGSAYGQISGSLPSVHVPALTWDKIRELAGPAFVIAMLGSIESLLSAVVADGMTGSRHNSNRELIGQGIANIVTPLFGGIPATGAIARTATNVRTGAVSPMSGIIHGVFVLVVLLALAPLASHIPLAAMAPILMMVAWNMSERKEFGRILTSRTSDSLVLLLTFLLTVWTDLTTAVGIGILLALLLFVKRMGEMLTVAKVLPDPKIPQSQVSASIAAEGHGCPQIEIYTIEGPLFFGAANMFEKSIMDTIHDRPNVLVLRMGDVPFMDTTGESNLASLVEHFAKFGGTVLVAEIRTQPMEVIRRTGLYETIGEERFFDHTGDAIRYALTYLDKKQCLSCKQAAFRECAGLSQAVPSHDPGAAQPSSAGVSG
ncbi:MAG: sodium-independent anion transporter [Paenibacillus sp.]|jgi:SulP family sulfate permease|uniref:SulP family inorganic anion transporter n=1 Tax=Paenibacillus sp. GCM10012303 TaxID=3317340 RepID=UPI0029F1211B|nr:sodium-independent anion transporter [Paenibacillus sp.]